MAVSDGWTDRTWVSIGGSAGNPRARPKHVQRSLSAALSEAGLGETPAAKPRVNPAGNVPVAAIEDDDLEEARPPLSSPRLAYFAEPEHPVITPGTTSTGVVSPPPWVRAARRGRMHNLMLNAFGWTITLIVAGSIIGVAGRYMAGPLPGLEHMQTARQ
jgi:hypothetical protein